MNKQIVALLAVVLVLCSARAIAQKHDFTGHVMKCISGDCVNGTGVAIISPGSEYEHDSTTFQHYSGSFKNGMMDGEGTLISRGEYYTGSFEEGNRVGYGVQFFVKKVNGMSVPDSNAWVEFGEWQEDLSKRCIQVHDDGSTGFYNTEGLRKRNEHFRPYREVKDKWIVQHVAAYREAMAPVFAERKRVHDSMYPPQVIVNHHMVVRNGGRVNTARGKLENLCSWDCTTSLKYYVTASNVVRGKLTIMPIGGFVRYQVRDENDKAIWEGAADQYWSPAKDGKYKFLIIFDVGAVYGAEPASGAQIEWSLRSETL